MKKTELLSITSQNAENQDNYKLSSNEALIRREQIEDSPFTAIKEEGKNWILTMGDTLVEITEHQELKDVIKYVNKKSYKLLMIATAIFIEHANRIKNN